MQKKRDVHPMTSVEHRDALNKKEYNIQQTKTRNSRGEDTTTSLFA